MSSNPSLEMLPPGLRRSWRLPLVLGCTVIAAALGAAATVEGAQLAEARPEETLPAPIVLREPPAEGAARLAAPSVRLGPGVERVWVDPVTVEARPLFRLPQASPKDRAAKWIRLGRRMLKDERFGAALRAFDHAARLSPSNPEAWYGVALARVELGQTRRADEALHRALMIAPSHAMTNVLAGFVAQDRAHFAAARAHYDRYLDVEPNGPYSDELVSVLEQLPAQEE